MKTPFLFFLKRMDVLLFSLLAIVLTSLILSSDGFYPFDEGAHFVFDASALEHPTVSLGVWQRFGGVWLFTVPAQFGHKAVKVFASVLFLLAIFFTYKVAEIEEIPGKHWVIPLAGFQPVFLDIGYTCMAELPAALLLVLSYLFYKRSEWKWSLLTASIVFLFRYELFFFALILLLLTWKKKQYSALPWILAGPAVWYFFSVVWIKDFLWLPRELIRYGRLAKYEEGASLLHYIVGSPDIFGWAAVVLFVVAIVYGALQRKVSSPIPVLTVFVSVTISTLASSEALHWTGAVGDVRYLAPMAPFFALVSLRGLSILTQRMRSPSISLLVSAGFSLWLALQTVDTIVPHTFSPYEKAVMSLTQRASADPVEAPVLTNHWAAKYAMLAGMADSRETLKISNEMFDTTRRIYLLWDPQLAVSPFATHTLKLSDVRRNQFVQLIDSVNVGNKTIFLFLKNETH